MATPVIADRHPVGITWAASGAINLELSPKPYTITRMVLVARPQFTTVVATWDSDPFDRIINTLSLNGGGETYFDFRNMRVAYWQSKYALHHLKNYKRPSTIGDNLGPFVHQFAYVFHFGTQPRDDEGNDNPFDLSGGIPPTGTGNLALQGGFNAALAMGVAVTINACPIDVYLYGVRPEAGDSPADYMPKAIPHWTMETPTPTAVSSAFATSHNIPAGNFLHSLMVMQTRGATAPRDDSVLNSFRVKYALEGRDIFSYGGQTGAILDYKAAELLSQLEVGGWPPNDNVSTAMTAQTGVSAVPSILGMADSGLIWVPLHKYLKFGRGNRDYGADLRGINTGDLKLEYGVSNTVNVAMHVAYRKYRPL